MGKKSYFATLFVILLLVFFLFPASTGKERFLVPQHIINLNESSPMAALGESGNHSFALGDRFGFFTDNMDLTYSGIKDYRVSISDNAFINYGKVPSILDIQDSRGEGRAIIESSGFPVIEQNRIVILSESHISLHDLDGNMFWEKEILSFVTTLSIARGFVLIGYLDGSCEVISESGNVVLNYRPGGSRIESVYSAAISGDTQTIALISGLDPQRFIILEKRKNEYKPIHHFELDFQYRRTVDMYFSSDNSKVFFESPEGVNIFDLATHELAPVGGKGKLVKIYLDKRDQFYSLMLKQDSSADLKVLTPSDRILSKHEVPGDDFFFRKNGDNYYIGSDNRLMFLKMVTD